MESEVAGANFTYGQEVHTQLHGLKKNKLVCPLMDHKVYLV